MYAFELARKGRDAIMGKFDKNLIELLKAHDDDPIELVERDLENNIISEELQKMAYACGYELSVPYLQKIYDEYLDYEEWHSNYEEILRIFASKIRG